MLRWFPALLAVAFGQVHAADREPSAPELQVVLFAPADVPPPAAVEERLTEVANYTEAFFAKWMSHWNYPPARTNLFARQPDGSLRVLFVTGRENLESGRYHQGGFEAEVRQRARERYDIDPHQHVWWIWVYLGDPPLRFRGFVGGGNARQGGTAFVNFLNAPGELRLTDELGAPFLERFALKGAIHELGHAFGLPHLGPLEKQPLGMPLMGANIPNYRRRTGNRETRAYLSRAAAAMLWKHPVFSGTARNRAALPKFTVTGLATSADSAAHAVRVSGVLNSDVAAHSVVVLDSVPERHVTYWQKPYAARIEPDGRFEVALTEPTDRSGTLRLLFCFENGAITGDGFGYGIASALEQPYQANYLLAP